MARPSRRVHRVAPGGRVDPDGRPHGILGDQELIKIIGNFPLSSLTAFPGLGIDHATVTDLVQRFHS
jgi:hypothetical protein